MEEYFKVPQGGGVSAKTVYRNVYALCRWLNHNVLGVSHVSSFYNQVLHIVYILMTKKKDFCMCYTLLDTFASAKDKQKTFMPLPILFTQIFKEWMLEDEFNYVIKDKISIQAETISSSYNASVQIDLVPSMLQEHVPVASSSSSNEFKEEDDEFFNQQPPEDNRAFMHLIWEGIKRTYKLIKGQKKKIEEARFRRTRSEGGSSSMGKKGRHA